MSDIEIRDNFVLFWRGWPSNWYPSEFTLDNKKFNCVEQYMMYMKAITFQDLKSANQIMKSKNPKEQGMFQLFLEKMPKY